MSLYSYILPKQDGKRKNYVRSLKAAKDKRDIDDRPELSEEVQVIEKLLNRHDYLAEKLRKVGGHFEIQAEDFYNLINLGDFDYDKDYRELFPFIRLPFSVSWLEIHTKDNQQFGLLLIEKKDPYSIEVAYYSKTLSDKSDYQLKPFDVVLSEHGMYYNLNKIQHSEDQISIIGRMGKSVASLLLALHARNAPLRFSDNATFDDIKKERNDIDSGNNNIVPRNRNRRFKVRKIIFDPSRLAHKPTQPGQEVCQRLTRLHDVRGHWVRRFNNRTEKYTLYWRNAHKRGSTTETQLELEAQRPSYIVKLTNPDATQTLDKLEP